MEEHGSGSKGGRGGGNGPKGGRNSHSNAKNKFNATEASKLLGERYQTALTAAQNTSLPASERTIVHQAAPAEGGSVWGRPNLALQGSVMDFSADLKSALQRSKAVAASA